MHHSPEVRMPQVRALNHAVLFVSDVDRSVAFYTKAFGMSVVATRPGQAAFMRAPGSDNHHDLAVMRVPPRYAPQGTVGLYHLAWEVDTIDDIADAIPALSEMGALVGASDHGVSKSLYGRDPDGIEFEILWRVPREAWGEMEHEAITRPLDLEAELARWSKRVITNR
jgi:catechol-2,3-dioxygenase